MLLHILVLLKAMFYRLVFKWHIFVFYVLCSKPLFAKLNKFRQSASTQRQIDQPQVIQLLRKPLSQDVLSVWLLRKSFPTLKALQMNMDDMSRCIENQENPRLEAVLLKVLKEETVNVVIYGGSNSAQGKFPVILNQWWNKVITPVSKSKLNIKTIAIGGTSSSFYQFCYGIYLEENQPIDLAILETSANDAMDLNVKTLDNKNLPLEQFTRQILRRPNNPAVFYVNLFLVNDKNSQCLNLVDYGQDLISQVYGITTFNFQCLCCSFSQGKFYANLRTNKFLNGWHINLLGHAQIAYMIIQVISRSLVKMTQDNFMPNYPSVPDKISSTVPPLSPPVYIKRSTNSITAPLCWANLTPNPKKNILYNSLRLRLVKSTGFKYIDHATIGKMSYSAATVRRTDAYGGYSGKAKGSQVTVSFSGTLPQSSLYSTFSVGIISRYYTHGGRVEVWIDDRYSKRVKKSFSSPYAQTVVQIVARLVQAGEHTLTMRIVEEGSSVLVGVFVVPSEGAR